MRKDGVLSTALVDMSSMNYFSEVSSLILNLLLDMPNMFKLKRH